MQQAQLLQSLRNICGAQYVHNAPEVNDTLLRDWLGNESGDARAAVFPHSAAEVARVLALCNEHNISITPQGGNTGMSGGAIPNGGVLLCLRRMNRIRAIDESAQTITVEAGCILQSIQQAASAAGLFFPLNLGARGSCHIGGNLATNAGGLNVLRYGNTRDLCLGIEAVLASGEIINGLTGLRKDNTGYDLRHLLIGCEGTLAVITAATFRLFAPPRIALTALLSPASPAAALTILNRLRQQATPVACELMPDTVLNLLRAHAPDLPQPFNAPPAWTMLTDIADGERAAAEQTLTQCINDGLAENVIIAESETQRAAFWRLREEAPLIMGRRGKWGRADVALPLSALADFIDDIKRRLTAISPGLYVIGFGHLGDGNLHISTRARDEDPDSNPALAQKIKAAIYESVVEYGGSISAEHGIGQSKTDLLARYKDPASLAAMRRIKQALDPNGILNPGKLFGEIN